MPIQTSIFNLSHFPIVETHDPEVMRDTLVTHYGASKFSATDTLQFHAKSFHAALGSVSIGLCAYGTPAFVEFPECNFVRLQIAITGVACTTINGQATDVTQDQACITPSDRINSIEFGSNYKQLFVRIDQGAIERKFTALLGASPKGKIEFSQSISTGSSQLVALKELVAFTTRQLAHGHDAAPSLMLQEIEQAIIVAFLEAIPHSHSQLLEPKVCDIAESRVRLVQEFIEANWSAPINIDKIALMTGLGARSIFSAFKQKKGYTPIGYLKSVRLKNARRLLAEGADGETVTGIAYACGFSNPGHFARDYEAKFGELPSTTLTTARTR